MISTELYFTYDCLISRHISDAVKYIRDEAVNDLELRRFIENGESFYNLDLNDFKSEENLHNFLLDYTRENILLLPYKSSIDDYFYFFNFKQCFDIENPITKYFISLFNFGYIKTDLSVTRVELYPNKICLHLSPYKG